VGAYNYSSSPAIDHCALKGGAINQKGGRSVGLWNNYKSAPTVTNSLLAGATSGSGGTSYGLFNYNYAASPIIHDCRIDGGSGSASAIAIFLGFGGVPTFYNNQIFTQGTASINYGIFIQFNGRLYCGHFYGNNLYNCPTAFVHDEKNDKDYTDISDVNDEYGDDDLAENTSTAQ
jgi:hypothetical protein